MQDNNELYQDFDLDDILNEFHQEPEEAQEEAPEQPEEADRLDSAVDQLLQEEEDTAPEPKAEARSTVRLEKLSDVTVSHPQEAPAPEPKPTVIELNPKQKLRELKRKLIAGPEKRYYELSEQGLGKVQMSVFINLVIVLVCAGITALFAMDMVPGNRMRLVIFSQVLAMLLSALLGAYQLLDGLSDLFRLRFTANTMLVLTFLSCCVDAVLCLRDLRVPCCAAFSLEMALALLSRYHRRSSEMARMDTLRKAVRVHSLVKVPDFFEKKAGILRGYGNVDHFMENQAKTTGPEKFQSIYCFISFLLCIGIAVFAGMLHGYALAIQVFSTSLLVAVPASYFIALSRPAAILEKRLHMVGTVLCGWQGVKQLKGKAAFPLKDEDLFPNGSTKLNGVKFYGDRAPDQVITCAASLICASGSGLSSVFRQLLTSRGGRELPVKDLHNYGNGGIGAEVAGESVLLGNPGFLQDMGVVIPDGTMVNQAVYVAIDGELSAVVAVSYAKMRSASGGLVSLCGSRKLTPVLTGGDFMVTESLIRSRFGVNTKRVAFPDQDTRAALRAKEPAPEQTAAALTTREELLSFAYAISGARALRTSCTLGTAIHLVGGILGMLIMAALAYLGSTELLTPINVLLYQLVWLLPGVLITEWTRTV